MPQILVKKNDPGQNGSDLKFTRFELCLTPFSIELIDIRLAALSFTKLDLQFDVTYALGFS